MKNRIIAAWAVCSFCTLPKAYAENNNAAKGLKLAAEVSGKMPSGMKAAIVLIMIVTAAAVLFYYIGNKNGK